MLLTDVKTYLSQRGRASLDDLATHFTVAPDAMRGLLETWIAKGRARKVAEALPCHTCGKCESATTEMYEWLDAAAASRPPHHPCGH
jgi:hypothetical protein